MTRTQSKARPHPIALALFFSLLLNLSLGLGLSQPLRAAPADIPLDIPYDVASIELDGFCREYADAAVARYEGPDGVPAEIYARHSNKYLTLCVMAPEGEFEERFFSIYLDTDNGREAVAEADDYALRIRVADGKLEALVGTGRGGFEAGQLRGGFEAAVVDGSTSQFAFDSAEFRIPLPTFYTCQRPFGLAVYQHWANGVDDDYGWPNVKSFDVPSTWNQARLLDTTCAARNIRVCHQENNECVAAPGMTLYHIPPQGEPESVELDLEGFVSMPQLVADGDTLWALTEIDPAAASTAVTPSRLFHTSQALLVSPNNFDADGVFTVATGPLRPLAVQDLAVSAQWVVTGDPAYADSLAERIVRGSDFFYDFTAGQFMLGDVTVYQAGEAWSESDMRLYLSNVNRPNSVVGGVVEDFTPDIDASLAISYAPGALALGKQWNRYMAPAGQAVFVDGEPIDPLTLLDDWSIALAHELGHYLLFLFDTYVDAGGDESQVLGEQCYGSAMGAVYDPLNHSFIWDEAHWNLNCDATLAYAETGGRTEWETIEGWHPWTIAPVGPQPEVAQEPLQPPVSLTAVRFITPTLAPTQALAASQTFDLLYVDDETASLEARAFTFRDGRIFDQGKPPAGEKEVTLTDGRIGDRLCVYDLNDHGADTATPRYQFGCETIVPGDDALNLTRDLAWRPVVELAQIDTTQLVISVTQDLTDPTARLHVRVYPEAGNGYPAVEMARDGDLHTHLMDFGAFGDVVGPIFVQAYMTDTLPLPLSAREAVLDRGTGGGGAFGPISHWGGVLVVSSDGHARYVPAGGGVLQEGESIAWQSMPGTPPLPADKRIIGQSYRLDAYPASLVDEGTVALEFEELLLPVLRAAGDGAAEPALYFNGGNGWRELDTTVQTPAGREDGLLRASASSAGRGVYAVLYDQPERQIHLPLILQP